MRLVIIAGGLAFASATVSAGKTLGRQVFTELAQPSCTLCHTLADAGAAGTIGPNLDDLQPDRERVIRAVTSGVGVMPSFEASLTAEQIQAVADYVASVTRQPR